MNELALILVADLVGFWALTRIWKENDWKHQSAKALVVCTAVVYDLHFFGYLGS